MVMSTVSATVLSLLAGKAYAWGAVGHQTVGYVAMEFLSDAALSFVEDSLGSNYDESLGIAATWADEIKGLSGQPYAWASALHYVDALDSPAEECSVDYDRDCEGDVCILGALSNYTTRVVDPDIDAEQTQEALKFLDHFLGDIGQPLHVENFAVGGNDVDVTCDGKTTNLHSVWDTSLLVKLVNSTYDSSSQTLATSLVSRIKDGDYTDAAANWISCNSTTETIAGSGAYVPGKRSLEQDIRGFLTSRAIEPLECPLEWAKDSNAINCDYLFSYDQYDDVCDSDYYEGSIPILEEQLAKQGYRLAAWLNILFDDSA